MAYVTLVIEGGLFPADMLERVALGDAPGQRPADFGLPAGARLSDAIQAEFSDLCAYWDAFQRRRLHSKESSTRLTREAFAIPLLESLGFELTFQRSAAQVGDESYPISHRAGDRPDAPPIHIVSIEQPLDRRAEGARRSPYALLQEYLNRSDAVWGIVTNGEHLRLLRASTKLAGPTYLDFNLRAMVEGNQYSEFVLLYRLLHRTRLPQDTANAAECHLERYCQQGIEEGSRVRDRLRDGVEAALRELGTAFLAHPDSGELREAFHSGHINADQYYRQLLRLVYRLLFLFVVEERRLIFPPEPEHADRQRIYVDHYGGSRLRGRCERYFAEDRHGDLWQGLLQTFYILRDADAAKQLGLAALDGELFGLDACRDLEQAGCENARLLAAIRSLSTFRDNHVQRRVNYAALDVEELGSVYESLLDYQPHVTDDDPPSFDLLAGSERKQTGSYYTPPELVHELIESALVPVMTERLAAAKTREEQEKALLSLRICDPASGSGHFLLAAARRVGRELARVRCGEEEPPPDVYRVAVRDVIRNCIYAVDKNPLAVDLCKVALWLESHAAGLPLSFLDHHVKCGDSLVGVLDLKVLRAGIPDDAYVAMTGDDKQAAAYYRKRNRAEREGQGSLDAALAVGATPETPATLAAEFAALTELDDRTPDDVHAKQELYAALRSGQQWHDSKVACDLWTAAFFAKPTILDGHKPEVVPTTEVLWRFIERPAAGLGSVVGEASALALRHGFFHWPLEFPEVFTAGSFDVVLGNPPWERIKLQDKEFFATRAPEIAEAATAAIRSRLIAQLAIGNRPLSAEYTAALWRSECEANFIRHSGRFTLTGVGDLNTYPLFAEHARSTIGPYGRAGMVLPLGLATDYTYRDFFGDLMTKKALVSLFDFENREQIFPGVHRNYNFALTTMAGQAHPQLKAEFAFFLGRINDVRDPNRRFELSEDDLSRINPNTLTCPIFSTKRDADLTREIYRTVPVLDNAQTSENCWRLSFFTMFHMANDSGLFSTLEDLLGEECQLQGNRFARQGTTYLPLYESKMMHQFEHRHGTFEGQSAEELRKGLCAEFASEKLRNPNSLATPRYWVDRKEVLARCGDWAKSHQWLIGFRDITRAVDRRTASFAVLPLSGVGHSTSLVVLDRNCTANVACFLANVNSFVFDFVTRQKIGGIHLSFFIVRQLPVMPPDSYTAEMRAFMVPRVLELTYTAWDLQPFGRDLDYGGGPFQWDEERRFLIRCELDAAYFHLYGIAHDDVDYIMETFPIVKRKDEEKYGEYRTKRVILEVYDEMAAAMRMGQPYQTIVSPPPADPSVAHRSRGSEE